MSTEPSPLKYMGTQSQETVNMAAAMARAVESKAGRDQPLGTVSDDLHDAAGKVGDVAERAIAKAKGTLRSAADQARERATATVAAYTREDPLRAVLIAAAVGAVLMALVARTTKSGVRAIDRKVRR